ncbi:unnamed protein product [Malus baccata var. baccata]
MCKCRSHGTFPLFGLQSSHLNICYYHQDLHRRPLRPGSRPRFCGDRRALLLIGAWRLPRRPGVGRALQRHPFSGLVDSAVSLRASTRVSSGFAPLRHSSPSFGSRQACSHSNPSQKIKVGRRCNPQGIPPVSFLAPYGFDRPLTRTHVRLLGPCFKTAEWGARRPTPGARSCRSTPGRRALPATIASTTSPRAFQQPGLWPPPQSASVHAPSRSADRACDRSTSDRGASPAPTRFPPDNFKHSLTLFSKSFSSFPRGTCLLSVSRPYLALDKNLPPDWAAFPNNPTRRQRLVVRQGPGTTGLSPSPAPPSSGLGPGPPLRTLLQTTIRNADGARFSSWAVPGSLAVTRGILLRRSGASSVAGRSERDESAQLATEVRRPPIVVAFVAEDPAFVPTARGDAREAIVRPSRRSRGMRGGGTACDAQAGVPSA